jgi:hypothetical protein
MSGPYQMQRTPNDEWKITAQGDETLAVTQLKLLANVLMYWLTAGGPPPPDYREGQPYGEPEEEIGQDPYHCQNCGYEDAEVEFWPSDGNPASWVCPKCASTDCFPFAK